VADLAEPRGREGHEGRRLERHPFRVEGNHIVTYVNGVLAVDYTDPKPKYTDGIVALQLHAGGEGKMRFKDLAIREIK
jgi:hypothetical protein